MSTSDIWPRRLAVAGGVMKQPEATFHDVGPCCKRNRACPIHVRCARCLRTHRYSEPCTPAARSASGSAERKETT